MFVQCVIAVIAVVLNFVEFSCRTRSPSVWVMPTQEARKLDQQRVGQENVLELRKRICMSAGGEHPKPCVSLFLKENNKQHHHHHKDMRSPYAGISYTDTSVGSSGLLTGGIPVIKLRPRRACINR